MAAPRPYSSRHSVPVSAAVVSGYVNPFEIGVENEVSLAPTRPESDYSNPFEVPDSSLCEKTEKQPLTNALHIPLGETPRGHEKIYNDPHQNASATSLGENCSEDQVDLAEVSRNRGIYETGPNDREDGSGYAIAREPGQVSRINEKPAPRSSVRENSSEDQVDLAEVSRNRGIYETGPNDREDDSGYAIALESGQGVVCDQRKYLM